MTTNDNDCRPEFEAWLAACGKSPLMWNTSDAMLAAWAAATRAALANQPAAGEAVAIQARMPGGEWQTYPKGDAADLASAGMELRNLVAVRGAEPTEEVWQSMETAPKDRRILVLRTVNRVTGKREAFIARWNAQPHHSKPQPYWEVEAAGASVREQREQPPLGWMPLPQTAAARGADHA